MTTLTLTLADRQAAELQHVNVESVVCGATPNFADRCSVVALLADLCCLTTVLRADAGSL